MNEEDIMVKRFKELAQRAYNNGYYTCTGFLGIAEISLLKELFLKDSDIKGMPYMLYGGMQGCERCMAAFGSEDLFGYKYAFPIECVIIKPRMQKYADRLSHRDILGAVLNLGTVRANIGDIYLKDNIAYMFCAENMSAYITENLERVKHTPVHCEVTDSIPCIEDNKIIEQYQTASERIDALVSKVYKISRNEAAALIKNRRIYINGFGCESAGHNVNVNDIITVRGFGRFEYMGIVKKTAKGRLVIMVSKWN